MSRFKRRDHFEQNKVYLEDIRGDGLFYCPDLIKWFAKHGLDYKSFRRNGIEFEKLEATGDKMAIDAIASAKMRRPA